MTKTQLERLQVMYDRLSQISSVLEEILHEGDMALNEFSAAQEATDEYIAVETLTADVEEMETTVDMAKRDIDELLRNVV